MMGSNPTFVTTTVGGQW